MTEPASTLLVFAVIVAAMTIACSVVTLIGWGIGRVVTRYTVEHVRNELDSTNNDLLG